MPDFNGQPFVGEMDFLARLNFASCVSQMMSLLNTEKILSKEEVDDIVNQYTTQILEELVEQNKLLHWQNTELLKQTKLIQQQLDILQKTVDNS